MGETTGEARSRRSRGGLVGLLAASLWPAAALLAPLPTLAAPWTPIASAAPAPSYPAYPAYASPTPAARPDYRQMQVDMSPPGRSGEVVSPLPGSSGPRSPVSYRAPDPAPTSWAPASAPSARPAPLPVESRRPAIYLAPDPAPVRPAEVEPLPTAAIPVRQSYPLPAPTEAEMRRTEIYFAPETAPSPAVLPPPAGPRQVLQAQPGPALSLDFQPNPAWKRASIPAGSNPTAVGRVPPPAATPGFTIGAGDTVQITVLGRPELAASGNVSGDGLVTAALVGAVPVLGLTPQQAAQRIARAYKDGQFLVDPQVTVTMTEYQSQQLSVLGEVTAPGRFPMRTRLSILDALALAGGIKVTGAQLAYILRPEDAVVTRYEVDLDALLQAGAGQQYFELLAGDTVVVPKAEVFYIYGEVKTPNAYPLKAGTTVIQALSLAGGLTDKGSDRRIDIKRRDASGRLQTVGASLNDSLKPDDVVYIRERLF